jgi:hypothetical protein
MIQEVNNIVEKPIVSSYKVEVSRRHRPANTRGDKTTTK